MASGKWLLLLLFCCPETLVTADDLANHTVDRGDLSRCSWFFEQRYNTTLPDDNTDFDVFRKLAKIFKEREDATCYYVFFDNSSFMFEERIKQANEAGEALRLGWELSKNVSADMYCQRQEANCEWRFLGYVGRYFKSLDGYLTSVYDGLLTAIDDASEKLAAGEAPEYYEDVCTLANVTVLTCEILVR